MIILTEREDEQRHYLPGQNELQNHAPSEEQLRENILMGEEVHEDMYRVGKFREELATEVAPARPRLVQNRIEEDRDYPDPAEKERTKVGAGVGMTALILSILSLLFFPVTLGSAGIIVGIIAYMRGSRGLGLWAIGLGALSLLNQFFFAPMLY